MKIKEKVTLKFSPRKVWIKTFGCQMNYHDSERILSHLSDLEFTETSVKEEADLIIFNTCAIRNLANLKFYSQLGELKRLAKSRKCKKLIVGAAGCVSQVEGEELLKKYGHLDFVFGTDAIDQINDMILRIDEGEKKFIVNSWDKSANYSIETKITHDNPHAYINIIKGCNNFCTYCIVPFTRGREKSRKISEIVDDVKNLVENKGINEVTLLGQNVNSFGKENGESLVQLLMELEKIERLVNIRYVTSHPKDMSLELIDYHGKSKKLTNHLHLPVQSGSNTVLKRMNRNHDCDHYLGLLKKLRDANPNIVISSDIIVGFPNETEEEFNETLKLLDRAQFDFIYSYKFSPRKNTEAAKMTDCLTDEVRSERLRFLQDYQLKIQEKIRLQMVNKTYRVLVDGFNAKKGIKKWKGRTNCDRIVHFLPESEEKDYQWHWVDLEILSTTSLSAQGKIIQDYDKNLMN